MNTFQILDNLEETLRSDRTDGQLLDLFVRLRDEEAFATVVRRHGPMVLGVCRRILRNAADADDAFQAAFLVLARKAASIGTRHLLAQWLYGVAYNTARKLRRTNTRRATREQPLAEVAEPGAATPDARDELLAILDEELHQLPERYRAVIVLCDLQGLTRREAAARLACPEGTVAGRLARARDLLAARLSARGVTSAATLLAAVLGGQAATAIPPALLADLTRAVGVHSLAHATAKGQISPRVADATEGVLRAMFLTKLRTKAVVAFCCGLALALGLGAWHFANAQPKPELPDKPLHSSTDGKVAPTKPPEKGDRLLTLIPLKKLDAKPTAEKLAKLLPDAVTVAAVRDENALIVYASAKGIDDVRLVLRTLGEEVLKDGAKPQADGKSKPAPEEKTVSLQFDKVPWEDVLDWYSKETGLTLITTVKPTGSLTLKPGKDRKFTMGEITDLINEALTQQKFILIRRHMTFFIHPADEKIDPTLLPRIELSELPKRGRTELVQVIIPIEGKLTVEIAEEWKKLLTPFGALVPLDKNGVILVQDTAGNIQRILNTRDAMQGGKESSDSLDHVCKWQRAQELAELLKTLLADKDTQVTITGTAKEVSTRGKAVLIVVDTRRNALVIVGPPDKLALAKQIIEKQDKKLNAGDKEIVPADPILKTYSVPPGSATEVAKAIQGKMPWLNVVTLQQQNQIMVLATPEDHIQIVKLIGGSEAAPAPKKFRVRFESKPWKDVLDWYAKESGRALVSTARPVGALTLKPGDEKEFTLDEITDLLNDALSQQKWLLVHGRASFAVVPADEKVDPKFITHVELDDLANRRRTELVSVNLPLPAATGPDLADRAGKLTGPFGSAKWYAPANTLMLCDTAENLRAIVKVIRDLDAGKPKEK